MGKENIPLPPIVGEFVFHDFIPPIHTPLTPHNYKIGRILSVMEKEPDQTWTIRVEWIKYDSSWKSQWPVTEDMLVDVSRDPTTKSWRGDIFTKTEDLIYISYYKDKICPVKKLGDVIAFPSACGFSQMTFEAVHEFKGDDSVKRFVLMATKPILDSSGSVIERIFDESTNEWKNTELRRWLNDEFRKSFGLNGSGQSKTEDELAEYESFCNHVLPCQIDVLDSTTKTKITIVDTFFCPSAWELGHFNDASMPFKEGHIFDKFYQVSDVIDDSGGAPTPVRTYKVGGGRASFWTRTPCLYKNLRGRWNGSSVWICDGFGELTTDNKESSGYGVVPCCVITMTNPEALN